MRLISAGTNNVVFIYEVLRMNVRSVFIFTCLLAAQCAFSQQRTSETGRETERTGGSDLRSLLSQQQTEAATLRPVLDGPVNSDVYRVGPSDVFSVSFWAASPVVLNLIVSPEGTVLIPTVGSVDIAGKTLTQAKRLLADAIEKKYLKSNPAVALSTPRQILVTVKGHVAQPGVYRVYATDRVDRVIRSANAGLSEIIANPVQFEATRRNYEENGSKRNISIRRKNGELIRADILMYTATGNDIYNPYLSDGDEVVVPRITLGDSYIGIFGGVKNPGRFEYIEGDKFSTLLKFAHGLNLRAIPDSISLRRPSFDGNGIDVKLFSIAGTDTSAWDIPLRPGDRVIVAQKPEPRRLEKVTISGEIQNPGTYPILRNVTTLSDVITMAGGPTENAALRTVQILRKTELRTEDSTLSYLDQLLLKRTPLPYRDVWDFKYEVDIRAQGIIIVADAVRAYRERDKTQDMVLQPDDEIIVLPVTNTVYVSGHVLKPGIVPFKKGASIDYYVNAAGGFTENARESGIRVIKRGTYQALNMDDTTIEEGDEVWVPKEPDRFLEDYLSLWSQAASLVSIAITIILLGSR